MLRGQLELSIGHLSTGANNAAELDIITAHQQYFSAAAAGPDSAGMTHGEWRRTHARLTWSAAHGHHWWPCDAAKTSACPLSMVGTRTAPGRVSNATLSPHAGEERQLAARSAWVSA